MSTAIARPELALANRRHRRARREQAVKELTRDHLPNLRSPVALVVEWPSGKVILERDADLVRPIASLSKLMGALVVVEECKLDPTRVQEVSKDARKAASLTGGNRFSKLRVGWGYTVQDLLHAAMLKSDNKALPTLAEACGTDAAGLGKRMTARAQAMGLTHTFFAEPDGLSEQNVSTARETLQILREVVANPTLRTIMLKGRYTLQAHKGKRTEEVPIHNTDQLVSRDVVEAIGGKTGFTNLARYCLAAAAKLPGEQAPTHAPEAELVPAVNATAVGLTPEKTVGMVFLGAEGRNTRFGDFMRMYKWMTAPEMQRFRAEHAATIKLASVLPTEAKPIKPNENVGG